MSNSEAELTLDALLAAGAIDEDQHAKAIKHVKEAIADTWGPFSPA